MANTPKLTPDVQKKICDAIRAGNYIETAASYAGIGRSTLYQWMKRGRANKKGDRVYVEFVFEIEKALAEAEVRDVARIAAAAEFQWQASAWRLERKYPERWGRKSTVQFDNDKPTNESLTSLITQSLVGDEDFADVGKGFHGDDPKPKGEEEE